MDNEVINDSKSEGRKFRCYYYEIKLEAKQSMLSVKMIRIIPLVPKNGSLDVESDGL